MGAGGGRGGGGRGGGGEGGGAEGGGGGGEGKGGGTSRLDHGVSLCFSRSLSILGSSVAPAHIHPVTGIVEANWVRGSRR